MRSLGIHNMLPFVEVVNDRDNKCAQFGCLWALLPASVQQVVSKGRNENSITHLIHLVSATFKKGRGFPRHSAARVSCSPRAHVYTSLILGTRSDVHQGNLSQSAPRIRRGGRGSKLIDKGVSVGTEKARTSHRRRVVVGC